MHIKYTLHRPTNRHLPLTNGFTTAALTEQLASAYL